MAEETIQDPLEMLKMLKFNDYHDIMHRSKLEKINIKIREKLEKSKNL